MEKETLKNEDKIIKLLNQIEKNTRKPPNWQRVLFFIFTHLLTIIGLLIIAYIAWQIFSLLGSVSDKVTSIKDTTAEFFTVPDFLKFNE